MPLLALGLGLAGWFGTTLFVHDGLKWIFSEGILKASCKCNVQSQCVAYTYVANNYHTPSSILYTYCT